MKSRILFISLIILIVSLFTSCTFFQSRSETGKQGGCIIICRPDVDDLSKITSEDMDAAEAIIRSRLDSHNFSEATISRQGDTGIRVEIPGVDDPQEAVAMICATAKLEFLDANGNLIMDARGNIESATAMYGPVNEGGDSIHYVQLTFTNAGRKKFAEATEAASNADPGMNFIAISLDGAVQMAPTVNGVIDSDTCILSGNYTQEEAEEIAALISSGQLPFSLEITDTKTINAKKN